MPETEFIGLAFAVVVLILAFGSVLAMGLPLAVALAGVGAGVGLTALLSNVLTVPDYIDTVAVMIGLGVGIDYALFIVVRYREGLHEGRSPRDATTRAMDTAGRAVVFAGLTVVLSLLGILLIGLASLSGLAVGAAVTVLITMISSLTLLPALLGMAGPRVEVTRWRGLVMAGAAALALFGLGIGVPALAAAGALLAVVTLLASFVVRPAPRGPAAPAKPMRETLAYRWSRTIQRHPRRWLVAGALIMLVLAARPRPPPRLLRRGQLPRRHTDPYRLRPARRGLRRRLQRAVHRHRPVGAGGRSARSKPPRRPGAAPGVAAVTARCSTTRRPPGRGHDAHPDHGTAGRGDHRAGRSPPRHVIPEAAAGTGLDVNITGAAAVNIDYTDYLSDRLLLFFGSVLALSFLLLMVVFRSVLVPLKAVVMNVLSIGAAFGVVVAVFQWGWGADLFGISGAPIEAPLPMILFAIVFGVSMDYEVFLLSRVREEYTKTGDAARSVADGLASTARVITAAAAIMVVVFGSFVLEADRGAKLFGFSLALAVFLDATLVRMVLVPATMELLGRKNWWMPKWLDRVLPR